ncbi:glutathione S-transferase family protein [Limibaculum sp. M0105]|uniref:Glutathione S-transferase family protein n=1 Tax=Thermohalobaculum xanthum TaxID=2753746 RepID=A0A8J7M8L5_9RHOB|nr:glutathione binding-like protein [Thermohalobaculum xanthum]MBK0399937.1 glutathione S-transferase family protein [Thermohalobaculum xanthum]
MKLYTIPGSCSLAPHIALSEAGAEFDALIVDGASKRAADGTALASLSPKAQVPVLALDTGEVITENAAILQYIADRFPGSGLAPAPGGMERVRLQEHLSFIGSELHKSFGPFFAPEPPEGRARDAAVAKVGARLDHAERLLSHGQPYLTGETFTAADAYLFVVANWSGPTGIGIGARPNLAAFLARVGERPAVRAAMRAEGLLH